MKVLLAHTFHHARGGDSTYARALTRALEAAGHAVVPLAMRHPDNDPSPWEHRFLPWLDLRQEAGLAQRLARLPRVVWSGRARRLAAALIAEERPDVLHLQHVHRHSTPSILDAADEAGLPVVWTVHDYELVCPEGHLFRDGAPCEDCRTGGYRKAVAHRCKWGQLGPSVAVAVEKAVHRHKRVWQRVDRFLCPSRFLAETLARFGLPADRVVHQDNLVALPPALPAPTGPPTGWAVAARLSPEKGLDVALAAARRLRDHTLWVCGDGPEGPRLRRLAADLPNVRFVGHRPRRELLALLAERAVVAVPSVWNENLPYAVVEAQALGRAVVASARGGIPEQIRHGVDGLLVPAGDPEALAAAVGGLLDDPARARLLGDAAAARVRAAVDPAGHVDAILRHYAAAARVRAGR